MELITLYEQLNKRMELIIEAANLEENIPLLEDYELCRIRFEEELAELESDADDIDISSILTFDWDYFDDNFGSVFEDDDFDDDDDVFGVLV